MLPFLEVDHLPSSSSFYSAIIQPLGLRYMSTEDGHFPSITFGDSSRTTPIFQIRQVVASRDRPLRISRIEVSAPSAAAADNAYEFALRANPDAREAHPRRHPSESYAAASGASAHRTDTSGGGIRVVITDFVGNIMAIVYQPPVDYPPHYSGSTVRHTRSTTQEVARILDWNYDIASTHIPSPAGPSSASAASVRAASRRPYAPYPEQEEEDVPQPGIRRSVTTGSSVYQPAASARENSNGLSAGAVVGTLLGVAGAALGGVYLYNTVNKSDKERTPRQESEMPSFSRRSTFPDRYDGYSDRKSRHIDVERSVDKVRSYSDYPPPASDYRRPPPDFIARYSQVDSPPRSRVVDDPYDDSRGRQPAPRSRASSARPRSASTDYRDVYVVDDTERRSYAGSRTSRSSRYPPAVQRSYTYDDTAADRDSYVSARSHRSNSTVRGAPPRDPDPDPYAAPSRMSSHSRSGSRVTTTRTTYKVGGIPRSYSREGSFYSAQGVPLPDSRAPSSYSHLDIPLPQSRATSYYAPAPHNVPLPDSRATSFVAPHDVPLPASRPGTWVSGLSACGVPLPGSHVGSSHARWEGEEDDADSLAPSDSISCVGSRRSGRSRY